MDEPALLQNAYLQATLAAKQFTLPMLSRVLRSAAGQYAGHGTGSSMDFHDHRSYSPGDDPRYINWNVYARTGEYTLKLYREEVRPVIDIIFDTSESMFFESEKCKRSAELLYFTAQCAQETQASTRLHFLRGHEHRPVEIATLSSHLWLKEVQKSARTPSQEPPDVSRIPLRANSLRIFISDLLFPADPAWYFRQLTQRHGIVNIMSPYAFHEASPAWDGNFEFIDAETNLHSPRKIYPNDLFNYLQAYTNHFLLWNECAVRHEASISRLPAEGNFVKVLHEFLVTSGALNFTAKS